MSDILDKMLNEIGRKQEDSLAELEYNFVQMDAVLPAQALERFLTKASQKISEKMALTVNTLTNYFTSFESPSQLMMGILKVARTQVQYKNREQNESLAKGVKNFQFPHFMPAKLQKIQNNEQKQELQQQEKEIIIENNQNQQVNLEMKTLDNQNQRIVGEQIENNEFQNLNKVQTSYMQDNSSEIIKSRERLIIPSQTTIQLQEESKIYTQPSTTIKDKNEVKQVSNNQEINLNNVEVSPISFTRYKRQLNQLEQSSDRPMNSKQTLDKRADISPEKRNIVNELEERRQKILAKQKQSLDLKKNKKSRVFKINHQAEEKYKEHKKKQAEERIQANIDFLYSIKGDRKNEFLPKYKQWKNEGNLKSLSIAETIRNQNKKKLQILGFSGNTILNISAMNNTSNLSKVIKSTALPELSKSRSKSNNKGINKPRPYNLYNINQKDNEIFKNVFPSS